MFTRARFNDEYAPGLFALAIDTFINKRHQQMWRDAMTLKTSKKKKEEDSIRSGLGLPVIKGEGSAVTYDTQIAGSKQTWIHDVFALAVRITEEAIDDNLYELSAGGSADELSEIFRDLGESMAENEEVKAAVFFNSGTATTYHTTRDDVAFFSTSHRRLDGSTYANYSSSYADLTYTAFWAILVAAENQLNHRQFRVKKRVKNLWFPPQLERQAREIIQSTDKPDTGERAISAYAKSGRKIGLKSWPHLTDVDAWFMQLDGPGIVHFTRRKTRFAREKDFQTGDMMAKSDQRFSREIRDERDWYGVIP